MTLEVLYEEERNDDEGPFNSDVVRETTEQGQIVWLKSAPEEKVTSVQVPESPEA